jgi:hypothetical protein
MNCNRHNFIPLIKAQLINRSFPCEEIQRFTKLGETASDKIVTEMYRTGQLKINKVKGVGVGQPKYWYSVV